MSINLFFAAVLALLLGMFAYFQPTYSALEKGEEIPEIRLQSFTLYEISHQGIDHVLKGEEGKKFSDRYEITSATFEDNTKRLRQTVDADRALYRGDVVTLDGNVRYLREDGLRFASKEGRYDTAASLISTEGAFEITQNQNRVDGRKLRYNVEKETVSADSIRGIYQLP